ncbi:MAG: hypothetical protein ACOY32_06925 [Thermodesulfobacteriota bacterium]
MRRHLRLGIEKVQNIVYGLYCRLLGATGAKVIHCLGDSHLKSFQYVARRYSFYNTLLHFCIVRGATASGIRNPGSRTQGYVTFANYVEHHVLDHDWILTCLGEVDCGFVIWYRSNKHGISVAEQFALTLAHYREFLLMLKKKVGERVLVCSVPLPTIQEGRDWGEIAHLRREVRATMRERTELTIRFNKELRSICDKEHFSFIDLQHHTLDTKTMIVHDKFLHPNPLDHHLDPRQVKPVIIAELKALGFR